jgi:hypothetical protein
MKKIFLLAMAVVAVMVAAGQKTSRAEYLERYKGIAIADMEKYGIPASIKMAQGMLESDNGNSRLAREGNNHFGIKCKSDWKGDKIHHDDDAKGECFRSYSSAEESWRDHSEFLDRGQRYQFLFDLDPTDYKAWAYGLKQAGYATNPRYPELLIKIIEDNELYLLDRGEQIPVEKLIAREEADKTRHEAVPHTGEQVDVDNFVIAMYNHNGYEIYANNGSQFVVAREGDDLAKMAWLLGISERKLRRFNDLTPDQNIAGGNMVYIQAKGSRADNPDVMHTVQKGETLYSISQLYGIKMRPLARRNHLPVNAELTEGQQIKL